MPTDLLSKSLLALQLVFGIVTLLSFILFLREKEPIEFVGNWGGFGGGSGGWSISRSLGLLILAALFGMLTALAVFAALSKPAEPTKAAGGTPSSSCSNMLTVNCLAVNPSTGESRANVALSDGSGVDSRSKVPQGIANKKIHSPNPPSTMYVHPCPPVKDPCPGAAATTSGVTPQ
jgi:hypothetical protein